MPEASARPTPRIMATSPRRTGPLTVQAAPPYDRRMWEQAVLSGDLHSNARLVALVLAHHAGASGHLPAGHVQDARRLTRDCGLDGKFTRVSLNFLEERGYIARPSIHDWQEPRPRPVTLTLPATDRPPSPGARP
ncbi:hypothetical protein [Streptomyces sp. NBC_00827]|uniref:hypothetical protein n=1 Tax=Streptomyces sp. NBC_00827 TaxID=2903677 RepID=UPI00386CA2B0|nr:hypothetical protein OG569_02275 [Streptomyces sp. NBC_00827]